MQLIKLTIVFRSIIVKEVTIFNMLTITLSRRKWTFLNHGAFHCLAHQIKSETSIDIYCTNDPEYLSTRYLTFMENRREGNFLGQLSAKDWFASILSNRGMTILMQINFMSRQINLNTWYLPHNQEKCNSKVRRYFCSSVYL